MEPYKQLRYPGQLSWSVNRYRGFSLLAKETVSVFLYLNDCLFAGSIWNSFFFSFCPIFGPIYSLFVVEFIQENKSVVRVLFIIAQETSFSLSILIADSLSEHRVFPPPFRLIAFSFEPAAFESQINQAINLILIKADKCDNIHDVHQISQLSPLRHKGDQHEFSFSNIGTPSTENAMRIYKRSLMENCFDFF